MGTPKTILEILQRNLDKLSNEELSFEDQMHSYGYGECLKDLAFLFGEDQDEFGVKE